MRWVLAAFATGLVVMLGVAGEARAYEFPDPRVQPAGSPVTAFDWTTDRCEDLDIPDTPARAFRDPTGQVTFFASHYVTRRAIGPGLESVQHQCAVSMDSLRNPDPALYTYREWLAAPYLMPDGMTVMSLIHDEFQGSRVPGACPSLNYNKCWYNAITLGVSSNRGATFSRASAPPSHLVAQIPYQFDPYGGPMGIFQPSNIVRHYPDDDGYYYSLIGTQTYGDQQGGTCLMRTQNLMDPHSWRAWDGQGFTASFVDPYIGSPPPQGHLCQPVSRDDIEVQTSSLTYNTFLGKYVLVGAHRYAPYTHEERPGFYWSTSDDLVNWSRAVPLMAAETHDGFRCGAADPVRDSALLDPASSSPNFETTGRTMDLFFVLFHPTYNANGTCTVGLDRDLVRVPVTFNRDLDCSSVHATPSSLNTFSRELFPVNIVGAAGTPPISTTIDGVTQNEPVTGPGDPTGPDAMLGSRPDQVLLRDERASGGTGRVYRVSVTLADATGATCQATPTVSVPNGATDPGTLAYDSLERSITGVPPDIRVAGAERFEGNTGQTDLPVTLTLSHSQATPVSVDYTTEDGTATAADGDYAQSSGTVSFGAYQTAKTLTIKVNGDRKNEPAEDFAVRLSNPVAANIEDATASATIRNDDPQPSITVDDASHPEGQAGTTDFAFTVSLSNPSSGPVSVDYSLAAGTATEGSDYDGAAGTVTFDPGETTAEIVVPVHGDTTFEPDEDLTVTLSNATGGSIDTSDAVGTILNDDSPPTIDIGDVSQPEGNSGLADRLFTVSLSNQSAESVSVDYRTDDGTATAAGLDYTPVTGTVTIDPGQSSATIAVPVNGDNTIEPDESFTVTLSNPVGESIGDGSAIATLLNDDHGYARPKAATPLYVPLVPTYVDCTEPNRQHGGSGQPTCAPPVPASPNLTLGTPDANGAAANSTGAVTLRACAPPSCSGGDVVIGSGITDVRCQGGVATCGATNAAGGSDYVGELDLRLAVRLTDRGNASAPGGGTDQVTVSDFAFPITIGCTSTADDTIGSDCNIQTSANTITPGAAASGARAVWQLDTVKLRDAGPDGIVSVQDGSTPFAAQGVFVP